MQSELITLETRLQEFDDQDNADVVGGDIDVVLSTKSWETLEGRASEFPREAERLELIRRIQDVTRRYSMAIPSMMLWLLLDRACDN